MREVLPQRRANETFGLRFWNQDWLVTVGFYADARPGEVFIAGRKASSDLEWTARDGAILLSLAIQHGVPLDTIKAALTRNPDGSPSTLIGAVADRLSGTHQDSLVKVVETSKCRAKGGHARAAKLTAEQRAEIASRAGAARWARHRKPDGNGAQP
jgi:hypothetical protein